MFLSLFSEVFKARDKKNPGQIVALKKILMENEKEGVSANVYLFFIKLSEIITILPFILYILIILSTILHRIINNNCSIEIGSSLKIICCVDIDQAISTYKNLKMQCIYFTCAIPEPIIYSIYMNV